MSETLAETDAPRLRAAHEHTAVLAVGTLVGRYRIEAPLGAGAMGIVYRARDTELDRSVALKLVKPQRDAEQLAARLRRESRLQARAAHHSVIAVHDIGRDGDRVYVAMELIEGATLTRWLAMAPRAWHEILDVFREAGGGLAAAHAAGLVHRDFKPDNVLVEVRDDRVTRVLVSDFGVARALGEAEAEHGRASQATLAMTATGALVGTPAYMSPEQLDGQPADERADVFSFCVALWEALYSERPFRGDTIGAIVAAFAHPPEPPSDARSPRWLAGVLRAGLVIDRDQRTRAMTALLEALNWRRRAARRRLATGAATLALGGGAVALALWYTSEPGICDVQARVGADVARAGGELADVIALDSPGLARYWRDAASTYDRVWTRLRAQACQIGEDVQAHCLDRLGAEAAALLDAARVADPIRRGDMLRNLVLDAPRECLSPAAAHLLATNPRDLVVRRARHLLAMLSGADARDAKLLAAPLAEARMLVEVSGLDVLRIELEMYERIVEPQSTATLQDLARRAERAGHHRAAAWAWLESITGRDPDQTSLAAADGALARAGEPTRLRARWHAYRSAIAALHDDAPGAREAMATARALVAEIESPYDLTLEHVFSQILVRLGDHTTAETVLARAIEFARLAGVAGSTMIWLQTDHAQQLYWLERTGEADAVIAELLAGVDPRRPLPSARLASTLRVRAEALSWGEPQPLLDFLDRWAPTLDATLPRDALARVPFEGYRAQALAHLERYEQAERYARRSLELNLQHTGATSRYTADSRFVLGQILGNVGERDEAIAQLERAIVDSVAVADADDPRLAQARMIVAGLLLGQGRVDDARAAAELALPVYERSPILPRGERGILRWTLAQSLRGTDPTRERALVTAALEDWSGDPAGYAEQIAAARARLRP